MDTRRNTHQKVYYSNSNGQYRMHIESEESVETYYGESPNAIKVLLSVGEIYVYDPPNPTKKRDRTNKGRVVKPLGFTDSFLGDAIFRYLDNGRRGRTRISNLRTPEKWEYEESNS